MLNGVYLAQWPAANKKKHPDRRSCWGRGGGGVEGGLRGPLYPGCKLAASPEPARSVLVGFARFLNLWNRHPGFPEADRAYDNQDFSYVIDESLPNLYESSDFRRFHAAEKDLDFESIVGILFTKSDSVSEVRMPPSTQSNPFDVSTFAFAVWVIDSGASQAGAVSIAGNISTPWVLWVDISPIARPHRGVTPLR
jgi:hypothetical protein